MNNSGFQFTGTVWKLVESSSNMIWVLAQGSAAAFGAVYPFISAFLGLFGGFVSGSEASTIAMFTKYHILTSKLLNVDALIVTAATGIGGGLASVISPAKLQNAAATIDALGIESQVIRNGLCDLPDHHDRSGDHGPGLCLRKTVSWVTLTSHSPVHRWQGSWVLPVFSSRRKILRRDLPLLASFKLTYRCNLRCAPCPYHRREDASRAHIRWETATAALDALHRAGCRIVVFEGGEPLLWSDGTRTFSDLVRYARERFLCTAATTNGTLPLDVPVDVLWVSLDGTKETHDRLRSGSFDRAWENLGHVLSWKASRPFHDEPGKLAGPG